MGRKHSDENRFRFQSFGDRISAIRIGANVKIKRFDSIPEDAETFLGENLRRWVVNNCSTEFSVFECQLTPISESLPLVYLHREKIVQLFRTNLASATKLSLETLLDLLVHFARDLSSEFAPFAQEFVSLLVNISLTNKKDPEVLEWTFSCMAHLLKLLWKYFISDLEKFLDIVLPTFDEKVPSYIRQFSAESFAFLVRKTTDLLAAIRLIVNVKLQAHPNCSYGLGLVVFEVVRGANKTLLPCTENVVKLMIELCSKAEIDSPQTEMFQIFLNSCAEHIAVNSCTVIFKLLCGYLQSTASADSCSNVAHAASLLTTWLSYRHGMFCCDANAVAKAVIDVLVWHHSHESCVDSLLSILSNIIDLESNALPSMLCYVVIKNLFDLPLKRHRLLDFSLRHVSGKNFAACFLPHILSMLLKLSEKDQNETVKRKSPTDHLEDYDLCDMATDHQVYEAVEEGHMLARESLLTILTKLALQSRYQDDTVENISLPKKLFCEFAEVVRLKTDEFLNGENSENESALSYIWCVAVITSRYGILAEHDKCESAKSLALAFSKFNSAAKQRLLSPTSPFSDEKLLCQTLATLAEVASCFSSMGSEVFEKYTSFCSTDIVPLLTAYPNRLPSLALAITITELCVQDTSEKGGDKCKQFYSTLLPLVESSLASPVSEIRRLALQILELVGRPIYEIHIATFALNGDKKLGKPGVNILATLLAAEQTPATLQQYKDRLNLLQKIRADIIGNQPEAISWQRLCVFSLLGQLSIDFSLMHKPVNELLANYVEHIPRQTFWSVFESVLTKTHRTADDDATNFVEDCTPFELTKSCCELFSYNHNEMERKVVFNSWHSLRVRLWDAMRSFRVEELESNSRHYVPLFLDFVSNSFSNILSSANLPLVNLMTAPSSEKRSRRLRPSTSFAERRRCLVTMLSVFSKLRHRSQLVSADKIVATVFRLLKLPRPELQRPALDFLINTNWPGIIAYKDILTNLLEPNKYRSSLVEFGDLSVVGENDRKNVLPILLRLIFGQMHYVKNKSRSGKSGYAKKSASLAFLANINVSEVSLFMDIILEPFFSSAKWFTPAFNTCPDQATDFVDVALLDGVDAMSFPSTELQFWFFHTFIDAVSNLHNAASDQWRKFFRIAVILYTMIMKILSTFAQALDKEHEKRLRRLRKLAFKSFGVYFTRCGDSFTEWVDGDGDISSMLSNVVWPEFKRCTADSELLPLLSIATIWATDISLRKILLHRNPEDPDTSLLSAVINTMKLKLSGASVDIRIADAYLQFFDCLLPSETDEAMSDRQDDSATAECLSQLFSHQSVVISLISTVLSLSKKDKLCRKRVPKTLDIFQRVTAKVDNPSRAGEVFQLLLSLLSNHSLKADESQLSALKSIREVVPALAVVTQAQVNMLAQCFFRISGRQCREQLCQLLALLSEKLLPKYSNVSQLVQHLNSYSQKLDELDYECRLAAFTECIRLLQQQNLDAAEVGILLNNCLFFLLNVDDFSIRANSSEMISEIVRWAGACLETGGTNSISRKLVVHTVVTACSRGIQHHSELVRNEFLRVLAELVRNFPQHSTLVGLVHLTDDDADADFFENMRHVQQHRRARAMRRLAQFLTQQHQHLDPNKAIGLRPLTVFLMPLAQMYLMAAANGRVKSSMIDAALELLRACCFHLPWPAYHRILSKLLSQLLSGNLEKISFNIRAVAAVLDAYHFVSFSAVTSDVQVLGTPMESSKDEKPDSDKTVLRAIQTKIIPDIIEAINAQLLPGSLASSQCAVIPLTMAAVRLLVHCPVSYRDMTVPCLVLKLIEFLKSRFLEVRQAARKSLGQICLTMGPSHFNWIVRDLRISLTRGYQRHVLTFTVGDLVRTVQPVLQPGQLDTCIKEITTIFCSELFSVLSEEKEADCKVAGKWPEAKRRASLHAYPVLANLVSKSSVDTFLQPLLEVLLSSTDSEKVRRSRQVLHLIIPILAQNPGIAISDLVALARRWLHDTDTVKPKTLKTREKMPSDSGLLDPRPLPAQLLPPKPARLGMTMPVTSASVNSYAVSEFGLKLLFSLIKHNRLTDSTVSTVFESIGGNEALESFATEVLSLMRLGENEVVLHAALQLASCLLTFRVSAFTSRLSTLADSVFELLKAELLQKNTQSRLLVACFKAAGILVELARSESVGNNANRASLDSEQIDALLVCIDEAVLGDRQSVFALQLLKKVLDASLKAQQLAEIINGTITKTALRGRDECQPLARACLLSYMIHYPIGQKSLEKILDTFIGVLAVENAETHILRAAIEMIFLVVSHFPENELERRCAVIFLPVAALFINSKDTDIREVVNAVLVRLLSRVPLERRDAIFKDLVMPWLTSGKLLRQQLASHVVAVFVEAEGDDFERRLPNLMPALVEIIESKVDTKHKTKPAKNAKKRKAPKDEEGNPDDEGGDGNTSDKEDIMDDNSPNEFGDSLDGLLYASVSTLVKLVRNSKMAAISACPGGFSQIILIALALSLHPHSWIRCQIGYLWFELFNAVGVEDFIQASGFSLSKESELKILCRRVINQILTKGISEEFSQTVAANCVFLSRILLKMIPVNSGENNMLAWFCGRVVRIAMAESIYETKITCIKRLCVFKWMAAFVSDIASSSSTKLKENVKNLIAILVVPLSRELKETAVYNVTESDATNGEPGNDEKIAVTNQDSYQDDPIAQEVKPVCQELAELFRKTFGVQAFTTALNASMKKATERRMQREAHRASLAITDPARAARLKVYRQASKREARKRRIAGDKMRRGASTKKRGKNMNADVE